ncbi:hypothetical protein BHUM_03222 [Candidatus Burkholderia humilis]|nr:hypothetical protein BHUM_03222 [Candidatus Burkholderia humilis]
MMQMKAGRPQQKFKRAGPISAGCRFVFDMTLTGLRKTTRLLVSTALAALAVVGSLALAGPRTEWLTSTVFDDSASGRQSLHYTPVVAKDGLTPVSAEVRPVGRADQPVQFRGAGSIRADITRYNEERSVPRTQVRPADDGRAGTNANCRN